jgi:hypothetical protein
MLIEFVIGFVAWGLYFVLLPILFPYGTANCSCCGRYRYRREFWNPINTIQSMLHLKPKMALLIFVLFVLPVTGWILLAIFQLFFYKIEE